MGINPITGFQVYESRKENSMLSRRKRKHEIELAERWKTYIKDGSK